MPKSLATVRSEILAVADFQEIASAYTKLKRSNGQWRGLSPFKAEKTPSFFIDPNRNMWKCFATNQGGNLFEFISLLQGLDHREAVEYLAQLYNIAFDSDTTPGIQKRTLREILARTNVEFLAYSDEAVQLLMNRRGYTQEYAERIVFKYEIGYCKDARKLLADLRKDYSDEALLASGVASRSEKGDLYIQQYNRVTLPIHDKFGSVIGFTGLAVTENPTVKYLHSPKTELFEKSKELFGFFAAKKEIQSENLVGFAEGPFDAIAASEAGIPTVAILGGDISKDQLFFLAKQASDIYCLTDSDDAGKRIMAEVFKALSTANYDSLVYYFPEKAGVKDIDDYFRKFGREKLVELFDSAIPDTKAVVDYLVDTEKIRQLKIKNPGNVHIKIANLVLKAIRPYVPSSSAFGYRSLDLIERLSQSLNLNRTELQVWLSGIEKFVSETNITNNLNRISFPAPIFERRIITECIKQEENFYKVRARGIDSLSFSGHITSKIFLILSSYDYPKEPFELLKTELTSSEYQLVLDTYMDSLTEQLDVEYLCGVLLAARRVAKENKRDFLGKKLTPQEQKIKKELLEALAKEKT